VIVPARTLSKHELQYTGRSVRGANGTIAWPPQAPQIAAWNSRGPPTVLARLAAARQVGQRWGSFVSPLLAKKACSPVEKMNSSEQSRQVSVRSWYTLSGSSQGSNAEALGIDPGSTAPGRVRAQEGPLALGVGRAVPGTHSAENTVRVKRLGPGFGSGAPAQVPRRSRSRPIPRHPAVRLRTVM
jgi:hypothetical protein